jgi:RNA polymerase sigma factor (sigma-70 family)
MAVAQSDETGAESPKLETIEELFEALESPLLSYAFRLVGELGAAEDLVQESFLKLHAQFGEVREPRRWLYRIVHNLAVNHQRRANKIVPLHPSDDDGLPSPADAADPRPLPDEQIAHLESIGFVRLSLQALDERQRQLIELKFVENLSYKEISARTGLAVGHVGYLLHHSLKEIAAELAKTGIVP